MTARPAGLHHFFVDSSDLRDGVVEISGDEAHHASRVVRLRPGEAITVADGSGRVVEAIVTEAGASVRADVVAEHSTPVPRPAVTLYQAVSKGQRMDDLVEKAVEVGVRRIVPFMAERTVVRWDTDKREQATDRWRNIARASGKQSRSAYLTEIGDVTDGPMAALSEKATVIVLDETSVVPLRDALPQLAPDAIVIVVGPEGSLSPAELERMRDGGASLVTLGSRILRTETAGPIAAAIVAYTYGTLG